MNRSKFFSALVLLALILQVFSPVFFSHAAPPAQSDSAEERARLLLDSLQPEEKVGQLFLVHFNGTDVGPDTDIYNLIMRYHIGGVILRADHDNFPAGDNIVNDTYDLIQNIQRAEWLSTQTTISSTVSGDIFSPHYIPLFIGVSQPGDGAPFDQILSGLTMQPSPMAVGATWDTSLAETVGQVTGQELSALGFNLVLGPSLDVLETPKPESGGDLGIRTFGGDPFWVGKLGGAYVKGLHVGSSGQIAVIGKFFPGVGGSDRPIEEEVSTVRKSLEQLKQIELAPFFSVTGASPSLQSTVDGLLVSHIRYQGFFGNIRATTRPISFDEASLNEIMKLEPFAAWRSNGGIMISDNLGSRAVRRFSDPTGLSFNARLVVRDAFLTGNDLLYLGDILDTGDTDTALTVTRILDFFTQKYHEDSTFAQRVDQAVLRILTLKYKIYDEFSLGETVPEISRLEQVGTSEQTVLSVARFGATLISPGATDLDNILSSVPTLADHLVFITDTSPYLQCSDCLLQESLPKNSLEQTVARLYGPDAGNQIQRRNLFSYDYFELEAFLNGVQNSRLENDMRNAEWIVISMQDVSMARPASHALSRLLSERDDLLRGKNVIVFAFNAPYFLDATNISKLTAYYALYAKNPQAIEIAARILFQEFVPTLGASPVSITGTGYDLIHVTSPDPEQVVAIRLVAPTIEFSESELEANPEPPIELEIGVQLTLETGVILDHNGNAVPDGTPIQFIYTLNGLETLSPVIVTTDGVARINYTITDPGILGIGIHTDPRVSFDYLEIQVPTPAGFNTPAPTTDTPEPSPTDEIMVTPTEEAAATPEPIIEVLRTQTDLVDWLLALLVSSTMGLIAYRVGSSSGLSRWSIRWGLSAVIGGLLAYFYLAADLTGTINVVQAGRNAMIWAIIIGGMAGWAISATWYALSIRLSPPRKTDPPNFQTRSKS